MKEKNIPIQKIILITFLSLAFLIASCLLVVAVFYVTTFDLSFKALLMILSAPLEGTGNSTISLILSSCLPPVCILVVLYTVATVILLLGRNRVFPLLRRIGCVVCCVFLVFSLVFSFFAAGIPEFLRLYGQSTAIYEEYYIDPDPASITAEGKTKNLIYIYLESMETTYASTEVGGKQAENYIPALTELAKQHISFSDKEGSLGGFHPVSGATWTIASLLAQTSGIPFSFSTHSDGSVSDENGKFAAPLVTLGDILAQKGYKQEFLCGSDANFASRRQYFSQHGDYKIYDLYTAREDGYIPEDYYVWWGYEDEILYRIAKDELKKLAEGDAPFNFTMLTVDTHHVDGYVCSACESTYEEPLANVIRCADRQLESFISWCTQQDFFEDTVIVIAGDHPRMDTTLVTDIPFYERTMYNCFINSAVTVDEDRTQNRTFTALDMFPTTLAAMGFEIEGDRLGLGVNLFSSHPTLCELFGYTWLDEEVNKNSEYYLQKFT